MRVAIAKEDIPNALRIVSELQEKHGLKKNRIAEELGYKTPGMFYAFLKNPEERPIGRNKYERLKEVYQTRTRPKPAPRLGTTVENPKAGITVPLQKIPVPAQVELPDAVFTPERLTARAYSQQGLPHNAIDCMAQAAATCYSLARRLEEQSQKHARKMTRAYWREAIAKAKALGDEYASAAEDV